MIEVCSLCGNKDNLVKSHIIPKSAVSKQYRNKEQLILLSNTHPPRRTQTGIYESILCDGCEKKFSSLDSEAPKLFGKITNESVKNNKYMLFRKFSYDEYNLLKIFSLSILYRDSLCKNILSGIKLGPYQGIIRTLILNKAPINLDELSVILCKIDCDENKIPTQYPVKIRKLDGINFYKIVMYGYSIFIKIDQRKSMLDDFAINCQSPIIIFLLDIEKEFHYLLNLN